MRKNSGFEIMDRIHVYYSSNDEYASKIENFLDFIQKETLAVDIQKVDESLELVDINGYDVGMRLEKVK